MHNIGHFRYLECSHLDESGQPAGDITVWDEIRFPFDPAFQNAEEATVEHSRAAMSQQIEEAYSSDANGAVTVTITNHSAGYKRQYRLGRWAAPGPAVTPGKVRVRHSPRKPSGRRMEKGRG